MFRTLKMLHVLMIVIFVFDLPFAALNSVSVSPIYAFIVMCDIAIISVEVMAWRNLTAIERSLNTGDFDAIESLIPQMSTFNWLTNIGMIARCGDLILIAFITHNFVSAIINILVIVWLIYLNNKNHKDQQKKMATLIGAKSQALLDKLKLPEAQPGLNSA